MISKDTLSIDWIRDITSKNRNADKILFEKVIRALFLLEGLSQSGLSFVFKGGTAVMLLQDPIKRFSIDVDILVSEKTDFEGIFNDFVAAKGFSKHVRQNRVGTSSIEKMHYRFYYHPVFQTKIPEDYILLDIVVEPSSYQTVVPVEINSPFIKHTGSPAKVNIPSIEDILADKLTAFAPNTTGIPYIKGGESRSMEIIKQLYDIGNLFEKAENLPVIGKTFREIAKKQIAYRDMQGDADLVIEDIVLTALCLATRGKEGKGNFQDLQDGVKRIKSFIFSESYQIEKAIIHASRAAYVAKLIELNKTSFFRFESPLQVTDLLIHHPTYNKLNKLKKTNPEAFFYWYQIALLIK